MAVIVVDVLVGEWGGGVLRDVGEELTEREK